MRFNKLFKQLIFGKFYFGQKVHCFWYNSWFIKPPKPGMMICKVPYKGYYYPGGKKAKDQFYLIKLYKGGIAFIPEDCLIDLKEYAEKERLRLLVKPKDKKQIGAWERLKKYNNIDLEYLNDNPNTSK